MHVVHSLGVVVFTRIDVEIAMHVLSNTAHEVSDLTMAKAKRSSSEAVDDRGVDISVVPIGEAMLGDVKTKLRPLQEQTNDPKGAATGQYVKSPLV